MSSVLCHCQFVAFSLLLSISKALVGLSNSYPRPPSYSPSYPPASPSACYSTSMGTPFAGTLPQLTPRQNSNNRLALAGKGLSVGHVLPTQDASSLAAQATGDPAPRSPLSICVLQPLPVPARAGLGPQEAGLEVEEVCRRSTGHLLESPFPEVM